MASLAIPCFNGFKRLTDRYYQTADVLLLMLQIRGEAKKRYREKRKCEKKRHYSCCGKRHSGKRKKGDYINGDYLKRQKGEMQDSEKSEITEEDDEEVDCGEPSSDKKKADEWLQLRDQIENWDPTKLQIRTKDYDDMEWLFEMNQSHKHNSKKIKASDTASFHASSSPWHCARYLPDFDVYALPYTVLY